MLRYLLQILLALFLGTLIGCERKLRNNEAGPRTHALVAMGSCMFMILSRYGFGGAEYDASRVASSVVSGVGFLGAGVILYHRGALRGLTTAAGVWVTSAVGMLAGADMELLALASAGVTVLFQYLTHLPCRLFARPEVRYVRILRRGEGDLPLPGRIVRCALSRDGEEIFCRFTCAVTNAGLNPQKIAEILQQDPAILSIEYSDER